MKYLIIFLLFLSCAPKQTYLPQEKVETDTISTTVEPLKDLKEDRTEEVKGYWKHKGNDSVYVKPYKRKPKE